MRDRAVCHLNIIGFKAAVAAAKDKSLRGQPYVIAGAIGGRSLALDCSPEAIRQGITPGMALAAAERRVKDLTVLPPDIPAYGMINREIERVAARYAPVWENDHTGNLYLDITGTTTIFGTPADCSSRILRDIREQTEIFPAVAVATNKLVSKVATRTIRPAGLIQVQAGTEAEFLSHQDIRLLPGMGAKLLKTAAIVGIREIGEVARLTDSEAIALFGKKGSMIKSMALGIDGSIVEDISGNRRICQQADFGENTIEKTAIMGAIEALAEHGGFLMRRDKLGAAIIKLLVVYADGMKVEGQDKPRRSCILDREISAAAEKIYRKIAVRRIQIRSIGLSLEGLMRLGFEPDLFEPETEIANRKLQEAIDKIQNRYGAGKITRGPVLAAKKMRNDGGVLITGASFVH
ncbi:MAG: DNA polymerase [Treponema sp.]|nr:DNA polymerase [Treponema sp.]